MESESRRQDLYTGLAEVLGPDLTASLMSFIPLHPGIELVTRADIEGLSDKIDDLSNRIDEIDSRLGGRIDHLSDRMDRLQTTLLGGFAAMIAALLAAGFLA